MTDIRTCAQSVLEPGVCCANGCSEPASLAALDTTYVEHAVCYRHSDSRQFLGSKPLVWAEAWKP